MRSLLLAATAAICAAGALAQPLDLSKADGTIRIATYNVSLNRREPGALAAELAAGAHPQIDQVVAVLRQVRPDVLLLNEVDYDDSGAVLAAIKALLAADGADAANDAGGIAYPHHFLAPSNTGIASGLDLDRDGQVEGPGDAWGFGFFPGQYGMAVLSRFPIDQDAARTFQSFRWADLPNHRIPLDYYGAEIAAALRLSSKSHWDLPVTLPGGEVLHVLASHPTPPVFDGPEDRNGRRNADEVMFWLHYIEGAGPWLGDDQGRAGGLNAGAHFAIMGDLNLDPNDGDGIKAVGNALVSHPLLQDPMPAAVGGAAAAMAQGGKNPAHSGDPRHDTADFADIQDWAPGNLRVDYVLPSQTLTVTGAGVFWPAPDEANAALLLAGDQPASDHHAVWVDVLP
mgnify:CR=1 FL=1